MPTDDGAAAVRAVAERRALRVRVLDDDVLHRDAELRGDDLGVGRLVALALRLGADRDDDLAGQVDLDVGRFPHRRAPALADGADPLGRGDAAHLDVGARGPMPRSLPRSSASAFLRGEGRVAGRREGLVHGRLVVAGVDVDLGAATGRAETRRVLVRELVRLDEVAAADLGPIHADLGREQVHRPLDDVGRLGPAGAAVGVDERRCSCRRR